MAEWLVYVKTGYTVYTGFVEAATALAAVKQFVADNAEQFNRSGEAFVVERRLTEQFAIDVPEATVTVRPQ